MPERNRKKLKGGVIGYGGAFNMGRHHLEAMRKAGVRPAAVAEIDPARLREAGEDYPGIGLFDSVDRMLRESDVDLITIITPHNTHADLAVQCLKGNRHVVCEKPLTITTEECDRMIAEAKKRKLTLSTYHNRHWDGCILEARKRIERGAIGDIVRIEAHMGVREQPRDWWRSSRSISGGILYDWGVHLLEYSLQLIDSEIIEVGGFARTGFWAPTTVWGDDTNEDEAFAVVRFKSGQWLTLCITSLDSNPKPGWVEVTGTKGSYIFGGDSWKWITRDRGETVVREGKNPPWEGESKRFYKNVADHILEGAPLVITPEWARRPIHILDLAARSARSGRTLKAKYD